jgi:hypothetical protein
LSNPGEIEYGKSPLFYPFSKESEPAKAAELPANDFREEQAAATAQRLAILSRAGVRGLERELVRTELDDFPVDFIEEKEGVGLEFIGRRTVD